MKYKNKISLIFISLLVITFLLLKFVFDQGESFLSFQYIVIYALIIILVAGMLKKQLKNY